MYRNLYTWLLLVFCFVTVSDLDSETTSTEENHEPGLHGSQPVKTWRTSLNDFLHVYHAYLAIFVIIIIFGKYIKLTDVN